eukprot:352736-Pelagomonas_calceolata.AAC.1
MHGLQDLDPGCKKDSLVHQLCVTGGKCMHGATAALDEARKRLAAAHKSVVEATRRLDGWKCGRGDQETGWVGGGLINAL